jgi:hypothetical protein
LSDFQKTSSCLVLISSNLSSVNHLDFNQFFLLLFGNDNISTRL